MYDYIIVGAGSAGCVVANRLSEDPDRTVLLLEAGESDSGMTFRIPAAAPKLFKTSHDWAYETEPQESLGGDRLYLPRGKVLGGSSSINFMIYMRGNRLDYDEWSDLGADGWDFDNVLPYFKRAEHREGATIGDYGTGGPLNIVDLRSVNELTAAFVEAAIAAGFPRNLDFNGPRQEGAGYYQVNQENGQRVSASSAYLRPVRKRSNLEIRTGTQATRVVIEGGRATGVEFFGNAGPEVVRASREVILSGGTFNSPQLLMLSGIGPADHLRSLDLPVVVDLPGVGQNLQDHLLAPVIYESVRPVSLAGAGTVRDYLSYFLSGKGPFTSNIAESGGFARSSDELPAPDLQFNCAPVFYMTRGHEMRPGHGFSLSAQILRPASRGCICLRSSDPFDQPRIQPAFLAEESDLDTLVSGVNRCREIAAAHPFDEYRGGEIWPGPHIQTDAGIAQFIRETAESAAHPVGACKMGTDPMAVVDPALRVHGVDGLRVIDASIMPVAPRGNTNAPTIMIGEKGADLIRQ